MKKVLKNKKISFSLHAKEDGVIISAITLKWDPIFFYVKNKDKILSDSDHAINLNHLKEKNKFLKKIEESLGNGLKKSLSIPKWVYI